MKFNLTFVLKMPKMLKSSASSFSSSSQSSLTMSPAGVDCELQPCALVKIWEKNEKSKKEFFISW